MTTVETQLTQRAIAPDAVELITITNIVVGHRHRQNLGDITTLSDSIKKSGLIHPIAVKKTVDEKFQLMAGGRRLAACKELGYTQVMCNIYPADLTQLERNVIELCENIVRKDMDYAEEVSLTRRIHIAMQKMHGEKPGGRNQDGHGIRETAKLLNVSPATVCKDMELAEAIEVIPDLAQCKNKSEAVGLLKRLSHEVEAKDLADAVKKKTKLSSTEVVRKKLINSYGVGDVIEMVKAVPSRSVDLVEIDPPYAIRLDADDVKKTQSTMDNYNEWTAEDYMKKIPIIVQNAYRSLKQNGWILFWFAPEPWAEFTYQTIIDAGFKCRRLAFIWNKGVGQVMNPKHHFASCYETMYYGWKGVPQMLKQGRVNCTRPEEFPPVSIGSKIHPTEKSIELEMYLYETFLMPGSTIEIPFLGSGNGILAANNINCTAFGTDVSGSYKDEFVVRVGSDLPPNYRSYK